MTKATVQERLDHMDRQVTGAIAIVAEKHKALRAEVDGVHDHLGANQRDLSDRITDLIDEYGEIMDYLTLPWYRRLITKRPR